ncbi:uncharacterized protein EI90DRAFT_3091738 [Cantharellus anzutake]|uniref:uncharacterized protein n=1 Tax=Cantharellus anzutake TaxID=1750568 RepID=UPI0019048D21|nr:uncharacterized protein EI90DRAFT_3091738 [Cantharellus anzutake]KAF8313532.1 hypothetical protein EI90DRAFT_3091738 [Cantharellus anzutake]
MGATSLATSRPNIPQPCECTDKGHRPGSVPAEADHTWVLAKEQIIHCKSITGASYIVCH